MPQKKIEIMEVGVLTKLIGSIGKQRVALESNIQKAAVQTVYQSIEHRNVTPMKQLYEAVGKTTRREALVAYFEAFGNAMWSKAEGGIAFCDRSKLPKGSKGHADLKWTDEYAAKVAETLWSSMVREPAPKSQYDMEQEFDRVLGNLAKIANKPGNEVKHKGLLDVMTAAFRKYQFELVRQQTADTTTADNTIDPEDVNHPEFKGQAPAEVKTGTNG